MNKLAKPIITGVTYEQVYELYVTKNMTRRKCALSLGISVNSFEYLTRKFKIVNIKSNKNNFPTLDSLFKNLISEEELITYFKKRAAADELKR